MELPQPQLQKMKSGPSALFQASRALTEQADRSDQKECRAEHLSQSSPLLTFVVCLV